jgi:PKHD-type hydroxylase
MFLQIEGFLTAAEVGAITDSARQAVFVDGRRFNPHNLTKRNVVADPMDASGQKAAQIALAAYQRSTQMRDFAFPRRIATPQLARYGVGGAYGTHIDVAFMAAARQSLRSDLSSTVFISEPTTYEGGELVIHLGSETVSVRGKAGQAVLYPSTTLHEIRPVTSGERLVMITFIESHIADQLRRELLYVLNGVCALEGARMSRANRIRLEGVATNLQRMWSS